MATENMTGIQTRAMTEAQCIEDGTHGHLVENQEQVQDVNPARAMELGTQNPAMNPTVDLAKNDDQVMKEYVIRQGGISLDWYVPNFCNTQIEELIKERPRMEITRGRILFHCTELKEFFPTSTFEFDLATGQVYTYLTPAEDIGIPCQQFDLELLAEKLQADLDTSEQQSKKLERIPLVRRVAAPAELMDWDEIRDRTGQCCKLWQLYAETSIELKRKSKLPIEKAVTAYKLYGMYISDVILQIDEVLKLFTMEKELRVINNRGQFPVPRITPHSTKIENSRDSDKIIKAVDTEICEMLKAIKESEERHEKEREEEKTREQRVRLTGQPDRTDVNFYSSTPIKNSNTQIRNSCTF